MSINIIQMKQFGKWGRAGNQFFQYAFLKSYAKQFGSELQLPSWVGDQLFRTTPCPITVDLPIYNEVTVGKQNQSIPPKGDELVGHDFRGYAQHHTSTLQPHESYIRSLFEPTPTVSRRLQPIINNLKSPNELVVGVHLRRGDYGRNIFPIIPTNWYLKFLEQELLVRYPNVTLFIATEDQSLVQDFENHFPQTVDSLGLSLNSNPLDDYNYLKYETEQQDPHLMDWYPDFYLLSQCDIILGPSSTFSFFAAMLAKPDVEYYHASLATETFERTDPWNRYPLLREDVRDYPNLEGIAVKENPFWKH